MYNDKSEKSLRKNLRHNQTDIERLVWSKIRNRQIAGLKFFRQYSVNNFILDFYCPEKRLGIEIDGGQHNEASGIINDAQRSEHLTRQNIRVLRFWNNEVLNNIEGVVEKIIQGAYNSSHPSLTLREGENSPS